MAFPIHRTTTPITFDNVKTVFGLDETSARVIEAYISNDSENDFNCSQFFDCLLSLCHRSKADKACEALEAKTINYLAMMHFLPQKEAAIKARKLSHFLFNHLIEAEDQRQPLLHEQEMRPIPQTNSIDLFDAISRAPYGDGTQLVYPDRHHLETLIFRTREYVEEALPLYEANPLPSSLSRATRRKHKLETVQNIQAKLHKYREILKTTSIFTEFPGCSYQIKKRDAESALNPKDLYEIWQDLQEAYHYVTRLTRISNQIKTESASQL